MTEPEQLARQAKLMESYGAHCVYVTDSGGRLTMNDVTARVRAYRDALDPATEIGIHAHENLSLSGANSVVAVEAGVYRVDASLAGHGAGAGNCPIEAFVAVANLSGFEHNCDVFKLQDAVDDIVRPLQDPARPSRPRDPHAGLRGRVLQLPAARGGRLAAVRRRRARHPDGVRAAAPGRGQEDMIVDIALTLVSGRQGEPSGRCCSTGPRPAESAATTDGRDDALTRNLIELVITALALLEGIEAWKSDACATSVGMILDSENDNRIETARNN